MSARSAWVPSKEGYAALRAGDMGPRSDWASAPVT